MRKVGLISAATVSVVTLMSPQGTSHESSPHSRMAISVDCANSPHRIVGADFTTLEDGRGTIEVTDGQEVVKITVGLGQIAVEDQAPRSYEQGEEIAALPTARLIAGGVGDYEHGPNEAANLICEGAGDNEITNYFLCSLALAEANDGPVVQGCDITVPLPE